jgi:sugar phosphate permease
MTTAPPLSPAATPQSSFPRWLRFFEPAPPIAPATTEASAVQASYRRWTWRVLLSSMIGYATFYFVRNNLPIAMPVMEKTLGISKSQLGIFLTIHGVLYGISKFANGFLGDRCNARAFMVTGLLASAVLNLIFGSASTVLIFGIVWMLNGWFQGMGFPPCARLLGHWFHPHELATKMSIWNISHQIGGLVIMVLCGYLVTTSWRLCFVVPACIALLCTGFIWLTLPDTPPSVGLPEITSAKAAGAPAESASEFREFLIRKVFSNKYIWLVSLANFFVYTLRYSVFDWGVTLLTETRHISIAQSTWLVAAFEGAGLVGALVAGWLTDRFLGGRAVRACVGFMIMAGVSILLFWKVAGESRLLNLLLLCACGFFIYGPQCLVGIAALNLATKRAAATAVGLTGLFGYFSKILSGWGLGTLVQHYGWDAGFASLIGIAVLGTLTFAAAWKAKAHGYEIEE